MAYNAGYYPLQQQQYTQVYPRSQPQNIYQQLGKPQPQPHYPQAPYIPSQAQVQALVQVQPHIPVQTPARRPLPQPIPGANAKTPILPFASQFSSTSTISAATANFTPQPPARRSLPQPIPVANARTPILSSAAQSLLTFPASSSPQTSVQTLAQRSLPQPSPGANARTPILPSAAQSLSTFTTWASASSSPQTSAQTNTQRSLPQPSPGANAKTPILPSAGQSFSTFTTQASATTTSSSPQTSAQRSLPQPSPGANAMTPNLALTSQSSSTFTSATIANSSPQNPTQTHAQRSLPQPSPGANAKTPILLSASQPSSTSTTSGSTANSTSDTSAPPPKKFTPIWRHTLPDYPAPAWGYAVGMIGKPHPKPKAQVHEAEEEEEETDSDEEDDDDDDDDDEDEVDPRYNPQNKRRKYRRPVASIARGADVPPRINVNGGDPPRNWKRPHKVNNSPRVQVYEVPGVSVSGPEYSGPSINVSGPDDRHPQKSQFAGQQSHRGQARPMACGRCHEIPGVSVSGPEYGGPSINVSGADDRNSRHPPQQSQIGGQHSHRGQVRPTGGLACGGCKGSIIGRIISAMGSRWHPACFRCTICNDLLEHVSSYEHEGRPYCHLDYHENFAPRCYSCKTPIIEEQFITLDDPALGKRTYHTQHFFCAECGDPFLSPSVSFSDFKSEVALSGDGEFEGFTVYKGHPYCEACHVRLRLPKCKRCKRSIRDHDQAVEALGGKWCWGCFVCASCNEPFEDPSFFQRDDKPFCERCFSIMLRNEL